MSPLFLIRSEYRRNRSLVRVILGITLPVVFLFGVILIGFPGEALSRGIDPAYLARQWAVNTALGEGTIFFLLSPFLGAVAASSIRREDEDLIRILAPRA
ncbi:MAG: hypothetical protein HY760_00910, partial [Nitrospirae bacterium]|nr:hypothetical protein [Nitrospirota bacterium]